MSLSEAVTSSAQEFYGEDAKKSRDYGRIINSRHFQRLMGLIEGQKVAYGGSGDAATRYIGVCAHPREEHCPPAQAARVAATWQQVGTDTRRAENPGEGWGRPGVGSGALVGGGWAVLLEVLPSPDGPLPTRPRE